jgi:hypothetical protein
MINQYRRILLNRLWPFCALAYIPGLFTVITINRGHPWAGSILLSVTLFMVGYVGRELETIAREAENCRKAFIGSPVNSLVQHCHHEHWVEFLACPAELRIEYILKSKPWREKAERLRRFRPLPYISADSYISANPLKIRITSDDHSKYCSCPWNAYKDIFGNPIEQIRP